MRGVFLDKLGGEPTVAFDGGFADYAGDLVHLRLLGRELLLELIELGLDGLVFLERLVVQVLALLHPILKRFRHGKPPGVL